jgi:phage/plasmid-associated DNA primase
LWSAYVIVVDEMAYADKSDIETVKHVITADVLDRRPMRKNESVRVPQCATLIGASNKTIGELIRDETGSRRFVGLHFREDADWEYLNSLPALDAWKSVAADGPDPLDDHRTAFAELQAREQYMSPVEDWLRSLHSRREDILPSTNPIPPQILYEAFVSHFQARNAGMRPKSMSAWEQEVGRLLKGGRQYAVQKVRTSAGVEWRWSTTGERSL